MKRFILTLACFCLAASVGLGQQPRIFDVPPWPSSGVLSPEMAEKYFVYIDMETQEYVISYPEGLGILDEPYTGRRITFRWEPQNLVEPEIAVAITKMENGKFVYEYTVRNNEKAKRPLRSFKLVATSTDDSIVLDHPHWNHTHRSRNRAVAPRAGLLEGPELRLQANMGKFVSWFAPDAARSIRPGQTVGGFRVVSAFRPGITTAYSGTGKALSTPGGLPPEVSDILLPLLRPEKNKKVNLTIGPKWGTELDDVYVVSDFAYGIRRLVNRRRLLADSPFVQEMLTVLTSFANAGRAYAIDLKAAPSTPLENEIVSAVRLTFGLE